MNFLLIPLIGLWRMWLGRGVDGWPSFMRRADGRMFPGATYIQYAVIIGIMFAFTHPWNIALTNAIGILVLARVAGHTFMLYAPGMLPATASLKGIEKRCWDVSGIIANTELRWWYACILRYTSFTALWDSALFFQHFNQVGLITLASVMMIATYRLMTAFKIDTKYSELFGWMFYGVALAI